jgi:uncharacterized protein (TIGR03435 family)
MLRALLEERFKLKLHLETRQIPVYDLIATSRFTLKPLPEGSCTPFDPFGIEPQGLTQDEAGAAAAQRCNWFVGFNGKVDIHAATLDQMAAQLNRLIAIDRPVINRTGIAGVFNFHFEYQPVGGPRLVGDSGDTPAAPESAGPSVFTAVQEQLGLKLEPAKGPGQFVVIDHAERPSEN